MSANSNGGEVRLEKAGFGGAMAGWAGLAASTNMDVVHPPIPAAPDPASAAAGLQAADWIGDQAAETAHREALAAGFTTAASGTVTNLETGDADVAGRMEDI